jgi:hypothetical protein
MDVVMRTEKTTTEIQEVRFPVASSFPPKATIKCNGIPAFRSRGARDLACLLDIDDEIESWTCLPLELRRGNLVHTPDVLVTSVSGTRLLMDAVDVHGAEWITIAAGEAGFQYQAVARSARERDWRLRNARDLLRYGNYECPLGDTIRVMATIDEVGSFTVAEGLSLFREIPPMAGLASLILQGLIIVDLDDALIGPDTVVRRGNR